MAKSGKKIARDALGWTHEGHVAFNTSVDGAALADGFEAYMNLRVKRLDKLGALKSFVAEEVAAGRSVVVVSRDSGSMLLESKLIVQSLASMTYQQSSAVTIVATVLPKSSAWCDAAGKLYAALGLRPGIVDGQSALYCRAMCNNIFCATPDGSTSLDICAPSDDSDVGPGFNDLYASSTETDAMRFIQAKVIECLPNSVLERVDVWSVAENETHERMELTKKAGSKAFHKGKRCWDHALESIEIGSNVADQLGRKKRNLLVLSPHMFLAYPVIVPDVPACSNIRTENLLCDVIYTLFRALPEEEQRATKIVCAADSGLPFLDSNAIWFEKGMESGVSGCRAILRLMDKIGVSGATFLDADVAGNDAARKFESYVKSLHACRGKSPCRMTMFSDTNAYVYVDYWKENRTLYDDSAEEETGLSCRRRVCSTELFRMGWNRRVLSNAVIFMVSRGLSVDPTVYTDVGVSQWTARMHQKILECPPDALAVLYLCSIVKQISGHEQMPRALGLPARSMLSATPPPVPGQSDTCAVNDHFDIEHHREDIASGWYRFDVRLDPAAVRKQSKRKTHGVTFHILSYNGENIVCIDACRPHIMASLYARTWGMLPCFALPKCMRSAELSPVMLCLFTSRQPLLFEHARCVELLREAKARAKMTSVFGSRGAHALLTILNTPSSEPVVLPAAYTTALLQATIQPFKDEQVDIFGKSSCKFTQNAIDLAKKRGLTYRFIPVTSGRDERIYGQKQNTVPVIFMYGMYVGGCSEFRELDTEKVVADVVDSAFGE